MTVSEVIRFVDDVKPNAFSDEVKTLWLNECEGLVQTEVFLTAPADIIRYRFDEHRDTPLLVDPPHDKLYRAYLTAMVDFYNGEYNRYQNTMTLFNSHLGEFSRWYTRNYRPADAYEEGLL